MAADIADARAQTATERPPGAWPPANATLTSGAPPLDLEGCVGEGTPADAMAQEALLLWVGMARAPLESWVLASREPAGEGEGVRSEEAAGRFRAGALDAPVLKAIFSASDAIRVRLAQSLLQVCGAGSAAAADVKDPTVDEDTIAAGVKYPAVEEDTAAVSSATTAVTAAWSEAVDDENREYEYDDVVLVDMDDGRDFEASPEPEKAADPPTGLSRGEGSPDKAACRKGGAGMRALSEELREHVVRLLLDSIPRAEKADEEGVGATRSGVEEAPGNVSGWLPAARRRDCTQLFDVLCALVKTSVVVSLLVVCALLYHTCVRAGASGGALRCVIPAVLVTAVCTVMSIVMDDWCVSCWSVYLLP